MLKVTGKRALTKRGSSRAAGSDGNRGNQDVSMSLSSTTTIIRTPSLLCNSDPYI